MTVQSNSTIAITMLNLNISCQYFQPVRGKTNCTLCCMRHFPHAVSKLQVIAKGFFDWFIMLFVVVVIGGINCFDFVFF